MSTKIYNAYCCDLDALPGAILYLRNRMWRNVVKQANSYFGLTETTFATAPISTPIRSGPLSVSINGVEEFGKDVGECGFHVWLDQGKWGAAAFIILFGLTRFVEFKSIPPWVGVRDFRYWNNTEPPPRMSDEEWTYREETWNKVALDNDQWDTRLTNIVFSKDDYLSKYQLLSRLQKVAKKKK